MGMRWTTLLPGGQITVEGPYYDDGTDSALAITGGTGRYTGAEGTMLLDATATPRIGVRLHLHPDQITSTHQRSGAGDRDYQHPVAARIRPGGWPRCRAFLRPPVRTGRCPRCPLLACSARQGTVAPHSHPPRFVPLSW